MFFSSFCSWQLWNTLAQCKYTIEDSHDHWVSCVRFSPNNSNPVIVSSGWDRLVKVWNLANCKLKTNHYGHKRYLNTVTVSPDGSLCASGGKVCLRRFCFIIHKRIQHIDYVIPNSYLMTISQLWSFFGAREDFPQISERVARITRIYLVRHLWFSSRHR